MPKPCLYLEVPNVALLLPLDPSMGSPIEILPVGTDFVQQEPFKVVEKDQGGLPPLSESL